MFVGLVFNKKYVSVGKTLMFNAAVTKFYIELDPETVQSISYFHFGLQRGFPPKFHMHFYK
jgi:hypothetical protein